MSAQTVPLNTEASILVRILQSDEREMTPDVARYLISMRLPDQMTNGDEVSARPRRDLSPPWKSRNSTAICTSEHSLRFCNQKRVSS